MTIADADGADRYLHRLAGIGAFLDRARRPLRRGGRARADAHRPRRRSTPLGQLDGPPRPRPRRRRAARARPPTGRRRRCASGPARSLRTHRCARRWPRSPRGCATSCCRSPGPTTGRHRRGPRRRRGLRRRRRPAHHHRPDPRPRSTRSASTSSPSCSRAGCEIGRRALGESDFPAIAARLRTDPALRFATSAEIVEVAEQALAARAGRRRTTGSRTTTSRRA